MELDSYDIQNLHFKVLLYQTGYITFGEELEHNYYKMRFPNKEVELSFNSFLWNNYTENQIIGPKNILLKLKKAFKIRDFDLIKEQLNLLFAVLPYDFMAKEKEVIFHAIIHLTFSLLGEFILSEVHTHKGRCDALVINEDAIFCFEFKLGENATKALMQIHEKGYLDQFVSSTKKLFAIGVNYNKETKEIDGFEWNEIV